MPCMLRENSRACALTPLQRGLQTPCMVGITLDLCKRLLSRRGVPCTGKVHETRTVGRRKTNTEVRVRSRTWRKCICITRNMDYSLGTKHKIGGRGMHRFKDNILISYMGIMYA